MLALRQVHANRNHELLIRLPPEFAAYREVEIIILPVEPSNNSKTLSTKEFIKRFAGSIPDFPEPESPGPLQEREEWT
ncbi:hypothetical protein [Candidatus Electrothrix sp.]|uniref:hypothetical protein n=2 Tax=Candidatus Electrothrix sp. TaxID=2170559 RepID=UPI0040572073